MTTFNEHNLLYLACFLYSISFIVGFLKQREYSHPLMMVSAISGLICHTVNLTLRWERLGHGPFINLYEILSSNVWSLMLCYILFMLLTKRYRQVGRYIIPLLVMLMIWLLITPAKDSYLPPTYNTIWLYFHVLSGKFFLSLLMIATALALFAFYPASQNMTSTAASYTLSYPFLAFAFCFETLMLFFGAIWAQDAWGRYWAWDPLETWAFLTWLSMVFVLHWRTRNSSYAWYAVLVTSCFVLAFLTFFGVPFLSTAPHQGMI